MHKRSLSNDLACSHCQVHDLCFPVELSAEEGKLLSNIVSPAQTVKKGQALFHAGDPFTAIYSVRAGTIKCINRQQLLLAFYYPSDLLGFDGIADGKYQTHAIATEDTTICKINYHKLLGMMGKIPKLSDFMLRMVSRQLNDLLIDIKHHKNTEQRFCAFLYQISQNFQRRGFSAKEFTLPMPRQDIANYLDLALETVSRTIHTLKEQNIIDINNKRVKILDYIKLKALAE
ncbi:MAG: helix-turn-helix domain-containing protein [Francisellaceae bacterium]